VADDAFELTKPHAILIRQSVGISGIERFALLESCPQSGISHDYGVHHAKPIKGELILSKDSHFLRPAHGAFFRIDFTGHDLHQSGLSSAVRPGYRVTAAGDESGMDILEEDAGAEAH